jgi:hypothetical protein
MDTLETAAGLGVGVREIGSPDTQLLTIKYSPTAQFRNLLNEWTPLICALNAINRGMGLSDLYPFVISAPVVEKLCFIHEQVIEFGRNGRK